MDRFEENKNLIDCAFTEPIFKYKNKDYQFFNCYQIPDANADPSFQQFYNEFYYGPVFQEFFEKILDEFIEEAGLSLKVNNLTKRKLQNPIDYDFIMKVEDRYGNIISYDRYRKIIDDPKKILYSRLNSLNIFSISIKSFISSIT